jgi:transcription antitermination factor NusG
MRGDEPHPVPRGVVEALVAAADADGILQLAEKLLVGGPVRLMAGPFAEQLAILDELDDCGRVRVLLEILGRQVAVSTGANNVLPV